MSEFRDESAANDGGSDSLNVLPSHEHRMSIAAIAQLFRRHSLQDALKLVLDGLENKRFSIYVREDLEKLEPVIHQAYLSDHFLQKQDAAVQIKRVLESFIDDEIEGMLNGFRDTAQILQQKTRFELRNRITPYLGFDWSGILDHPEWN